ncbi:MAG: hypothetical protein Q8R67_10015 [Rhodoferax sp.]|nr:hypothetical protein [Rhodoferax sp.]MDP3652005.1 hypothetical protein [Rhodoferax sp.]
MLNSEKIAIAAHLHVLLRRKTGRVTDTEWMASNADYASEIVRFARASAQSDGHGDLGDWADKLEFAMAKASPPRPMVNRLFAAPATSVGREQTTATPNAGPLHSDASAHRYVRGIR